MKIRDFAWLIPFLSFFIGYYTLSFLFAVESVTVPALVGEPIASVLHLLSDNHLNMRLLAEKPDADLPEGIVLAQMPEAGTKIKQRQNVFLVISKRPPALPAPQFVGLHEHACVQKAQASGVRLKKFYVASSHPAGICIAQYPVADEALENKTVIIYCARCEARRVIFPDLIGKTVAVAKEFLRDKGCEVEFFTISRNELVDVKETALIVDQKPRPGTLIDLDQPPTVRLYLA